MTDQQWRIAWDLYQVAAEKSADEQQIYVDSATTDAEVHREVLTMLDDSRSANLPQPISPSIAESIHPGDTYGRYVICERIGKGGMGEVFAASDPVLDRTVALKFLSACGVSNGQQGAIARFIREARSLSALNHPNIVTVHEVIQRDNQIAIVMELVEGQPLRHLCGPNPMPLPQFTRISQQIAAALGAAHTRGVVHRDIKPENVMVRPDGYAKVLDFGLARRLNPDPSFVEPSPTDNVIGTFRYMSPEQLRDEPATPSSDIYSLGLVLYEMVAGHHPFGGSSMFVTLQASASKIPEPLAAQNPAIPAALDELILRMLQQDPTARPSAAEVAAQLEELSRATDPRNAQTGFRPRSVGAIALGATAVFAGLVWWISHSTSQTTSGPIHTRPLTSQLGRETEPTLSEDGEWIAFLWTDNASGPPGLYVQQLKADSPRRLNNATGVIKALAWSPDGGRIAFRRRDGIYVIPRAGGDATKLATVLDECDGSGLDWSPDSQSILIAECLDQTRIPSIFQIHLATGERRKLTVPPAESQGDYDPRYSPDGRQIAFRRAARAVVEDVYVMRLQPLQQEPTAISRDARGLAGLAWMPSGKSLIVSSQRASGIFGLWKFDLDKPFAPAAFTQAGQHAKMPTVARRASRAAWINQVIDHNIWTLPLDILNNGVNVTGPPQRLIASLQRDVDPHISVDGRIAFRSDRSGVSEIWIAPTDRSIPVRVTSMGGPLTGTPRWSPDGKYLAFDSRPNGNPDIYLLRCEASGCQGPPRRLTTHTAADVLPSWSRDGRHIYFSSSRSGHREVWKQSVDEGSEAVQVTRNGGHLAIESADGRWLYYSKIVEDHGIWRAPLSTGLSGPTEELVAQLFDDYGAGSWILAGNEIIYLGSGKDAGVRAFSLKTRKSRLLYDVKDHPMERGLALSPDGRHLIFSQLDRSDSNIMIADGVR